MLPIMRMFLTEHAARDGVSRLADLGIPDQLITIVGPDGDQDVSVLASAFRESAKQALQRGRYVVSVTPPYGLGSAAEDVLEQSGAVDSGTMPEFTPTSAAPLSEAMGLPVLSNGKSHTQLLRSDWTFSSWFGLGMLSKRAAPLSSMFGMKTVSSKPGSRAAGTAVQSMSGDPGALSSKIGMKMLTSKRGSRARGTSVERMSGNAAPFSGFFGLKVLSDD